MRREDVLLLLSEQSGDGGCVLLEGRWEVVKSGAHVQYAHESPHFESHGIVFDLRPCKLLDVPANCFCRDGFDHGRVVVSAPPEGRSDAIELHVSEGADILGQNWQDVLIELIQLVQKDRARVIVVLYLGDPGHRAKKEILLEAVGLEQLQNTTRYAQQELFVDELLGASQTR